jgi:hypothetical protein
VPTLPALAACLANRAIPKAFNLARSGQTDQVLVGRTRFVDTYDAGQSGRASNKAFAAAPLVAPSIGMAR